MSKVIKIDPELMDPEKHDDHVVEEAAETLLKAKEIEADSKLMEKVHEFLDQKGKKITSLRQLRDIANNFSDDNEEEEGEE